MENIIRRRFDEPDRSAVQDAAIESALQKTETHIADYVADPRSFAGRYVGADLFKETFGAFSQSKDARNRYNAPVHNSATVLAAEQLHRVLETPGIRRSVVVLLTGIPGAGKTSSVLAAGAFPPGHLAIYEGQLARSETALQKVAQVLDSGHRPVIMVAHATPESALQNTLKRFSEEGRGAGLGVMADIQGGLPRSLQTVQARYGGLVELRIADYRDRMNPRRLQGWDNLHVLESEGNRERIEQRLRAELARQHDAGNLSVAGFRQALGVPPLAASERGMAGRHDAQREADVDRRSLPVGDRAAAFLNQPPALAAADHPGLRNAYRFIDRVGAMLRAGPSPERQLEAVAKAQERVLDGIERGGFAWTASITKQQESQR